MADRLRVLRAGLEGPVEDAIAHGLELLPEDAEPSDKVGQWRPAELPARGDAHGPKLLLGVGADTPEFLHREGLEHGRYGRLVDPPEAVGFREVARELGDEDVRTQAHGAGEAELRLHRRLDARPQGLRAPKEVMREGDVEKNLVYRIDLELGGKPKADLLQLLADLGVLSVVPHDKDEMGAEPLRLIGGHARPHAVSSRLIQ